MGETTFERLKGIISEQFGREASALRPETKLRGALMLDSLDMVDLVFFVDREFGVEPPLEELDSLGGLAALIERRASSAT